MADSKANKLKISTTKKSTDLRIGGTKDCFKTGASIVDILFSNIQCFDLGEISFKNNYTTFISIKIKCRDSNNKDSGWQTCIRNYQLMPNAHCETGSQDYFTISREQMSIVPDRVSALRLVLQQPSPIWAQFTVDDLCLIPKDAKDDTDQPSITSWLLDHQDTDESKLTQANRKNGPPIDEITAGLQNLWALTERMKGQQTQTALGRFDVDGSYEINLLSYT